MDLLIYMIINRSDVNSVFPSHSNFYKFFLKDLTGTRATQMPFKALSFHNSANRTHSRL